MDSQTIAALYRSRAVKQYATGSFALALYEYLITLDREIDTFWNRRFTLASALWFLNRYTLLFSLFPTLVGFHIHYSPEYPGVMQIISNIASGAALSLRVYALHGQARWVIALLLPVFATEIVLEIWAVVGGVPAVLAPSEVGCFLTGRPNGGDRFAAFWTGQLVFPTLISIMTLIRIIRLRRHGFLKGGLLEIMLRDGIMYFLVIFIVNLANVLTYILEPVQEDMKFANAPFANVITSIMICRLILNLRRVGSPTPTENEASSILFARVIATRRTFLGNLGEDMDVDNLNYKKRKREPMRCENVHVVEWVEDEYELETSNASPDR